jgi:hypothetical protein
MWERSDPLPAWPGNGPHPNLRKPRSFPWPQTSSPVAPKTARNPWMIFLHMPGAAPCRFSHGFPGRMEYRPGNGFATAASTSWLPKETLSPFCAYNLTGAGRTTTISTMNSIKKNTFGKLDQAKNRMEASADLTPSELARYQLARLNQTLDNARHHSPFYQERFADLPAGTAIPYWRISAA